MDSTHQVRGKLCFRTKDNLGQQSDQYSTEYFALDIANKLGDIFANTS
jgi:hypothetical protein